ncbi:Karyopherin (importin) beta [Legionella wadsworthii]|uniref:Karyopherin (Importin) beta n=1 Tax=Legionella wadsworthii TaxID=28088 RepID=A0A378LR17_9GAMM|nr:hypothetical protein [Legionella wadsworthii]STY28282.1 Karyopherin (importin) beta [Legionella wadsworthii]
MFQSQFFSNLPIDIAIPIYSKFDPQFLYHQCRLIDKRQAFIATLTLLRNQEANAAFYQEKVVASLCSNNNPVLSYALSSTGNRQHLICCLTGFISNPCIDFKNKFQALFILSKLKEQAFEMSPKLTSRIKMMLKYPAKKNTQEALIVLSNVALCLDPTDVAEFVPEVSNILTTYSNIHVCQKAIDCLTALIPRLKQADLSTLMPLIARKLTHIDETVRQKALGWICVYVSYTKANDLALFALIKNHLNDDNRAVRDAALDCLTAFVPFLLSEQFIELLPGVVNQLIEKDKRINKNALQLLKKLCHHLQPSDLKTFLPLITARLNNKNLFHRLQSLILLTLIANQLQPEELLPLFSPLIKQLRDADTNVRKAAFECWITCSSHFTQADLNNLIPSLINQWVHEDEKEPSRQVLKAFISRLNPSELVHLVPLITTRLTNGTDGVRAADIDYFSIFSSYITPENLSTLLHSLTMGLSNDDENVCILSLNYLSNLAPYLQKSDIRIFLPLIANKLDLRTFTIGTHYRLQAALSCLNTLACYLERADLMPFFTHLFALLNSSPGYCETEIFDCIGALAPFLQEEDLISLSPLIVKNLKHWHSEVKESATRSLIQIAACLKPMNLTVLLSLVISNLEDTNWKVTRSTLFCLSALIPYLDEGHQAMFLSAIKSQLNDDSFQIREGTLQCLSGMGSFLTYEDLGELAMGNQLKDPVFYEQFYKFVNQIISIKNISHQEIVKRLKLFESYNDPSIEVFLSHYNNLLSECHNTAINSKFQA